MRLIHTDNEVVKLRQHISKGSAQRFLELMEVELRVSLAVEYFSDIENEKLNIRSLFNNRVIWSYFMDRYHNFTIVNLRSTHF